MKETKEKISSAIDKAKLELEEALYQLEKLPTISEDAVGFAAHALANFITVTGGTVELLKLALASHADPGVHTLLDALRHSNELMTHTVGQIQSASFGRDNRVVLAKTDLGSIAQRLTEFYQAIANKKQIHFIFEPSDKEPLVWSDKVLAAVALDNLLSNAVKFSPPGGRIWVRVLVEDDAVVCSVQDEGPGLGRGDHAKLFQRGVTLTPRPTANEPSTGYGLAVTKEFIERLDGSIWCESALGEGSSFAFRLPRYREELGEAREENILP